METDRTTRSALDGVRVLDLSTSIAGQYCARLLADYGAQVVLAEPAEGSPTRAIGPFTARRAAPENSLLFWHLNTAKRSVVLETDPERRDAQLRALAAGLDVVVVDAAQKERILALVDPEATVVCSVSDFGLTGPRRDWTGGELIHQALSGVMFVTGSPEREPLYGVGQRASYACGVTAYSSVLAALWVRARTGRAQEVEAVVSEACAAMGQQLVTQYSFTQSYAQRGNYVGGGMNAQLQMKDGWIIMWVQRQWATVCDIFGAPEAIEDPRFADFTLLQRHWLDALAILQAHAREKTVAEVFDRLQAAKFSVSRIATPAEVVETAHYRDRDFFVPVDDGDMMMLGPAFRTSTPCRRAVAAPRLGQHSAEPWIGAPSVRPTPAAAPGAGSLPLEGVRVLDLTLAWAGPMAARGLAFLGAEVIKIENAAPLDPWRGPLRADPGSPWHADGDPGEAPWNRYSLFVSQNHDKQSISLNLKDPRAVEIAQRLAAQCDVVLANFSPRVLDRLGLGYDALKALKPDIIVVEMPAYGNTGPWSGYVGVGKTMEVATGMVGMMGYGDGRPYLTGPAYLDPIGGLHGTAAVLTALLQRQRDGIGQYVEVAQVEAAIHWIGEYILHAALDGGVFEVAGNRLPTAAPHDAFPAAGCDEWVVIAAYDDDQWRRLVAATGLKALADPAFATLAGRQAAHAEIRAALSGWTAARDKHHAAILLQTHGVPAAPVQNGGDIHRDPHLWARDFIRTLDHPGIGARDLTTLAYRLARTPGAIRKPAPLFAADTYAVLQRLLGLDVPEIGALVRDDVARLEPLKG